MIAMFETGKLATKHSAIRETDCPDDTGERISLVLKPVFVECSCHETQLRFSSCNYDLPKHEQLIA